MSGGRSLYLQARLRVRGESASFRGDGLPALRHRSAAFAMIGMGRRAFCCGRWRQY